MTDHEADRAEEAARQVPCPASRASSERFASVSRPVYASIASGSEKAIACQLGERAEVDPPALDRVAGEDEARTRARRAAAASSRSTIATTKAAR